MVIPLKRRRMERELIRFEEVGGEDVAQQVKNLSAMQNTQETQVRYRGLGRSPGERNGNPL